MTRQIDVCNLLISVENFLSPKNGQILAVFGVWGSAVWKSFDFYCKRHIYMYTWIHVVCDIPRENWLEGVTSRSVREKIKKVTNIVYFIYLTRSPRCSDRYQICSGGWYPGHNRMCQISFQSVQGFWFCRGSNFGQWGVAVNTGLNYRSRRSACDRNRPTDLCFKARCILGIYLVKLFCILYCFALSCLDFLISGVVQA